MTTSDSKPIKSWKTWFEVIATVAMLAMGGVLIWQNGAKGTESDGARPRSIGVPDKPFSVADSQFHGSRDARVVLIEFSDFECPACATFARDTRPDLVKEYVDTGKVLLAFRNFPLPIHPRATPAAAAGLCAAQQGRFADMHSRLFAFPMRLETSELRQAAGESGLDLDRFDRCVSDPVVLSAIERQRLQAEELNLPATPAFYVGTALDADLVKVTDAFVGSRSLNSFKAVLDPLLKSGR